LFEIAGIPENIAREALHLGAYKLPCKCKVIKRDVIVQRKFKIKAEPVVAKPAATQPELVNDKSAEKKAADAKPAAGDKGGAK
jgi:hypothetical protein